MCRCACFSFTCNCHCFVEEVLLQVSIQDTFNKERKSNAVGAFQRCNCTQECNQRIQLHCIALHCITLCYITLHCTTLHYISNVYGNGNLEQGQVTPLVAPHCQTSLHCHYSTSHYIALHYIKQGHVTHCQTSLHCQRPRDVARSQPGAQHTGEKPAAQ